MSPIGEGYNRAKIAQKVRFNGSAGSSFAGSTTPTISSALSSLLASLSSSNDFEIGSNYRIHRNAAHRLPRRAQSHGCTLLEGEGGHRRRSCRSTRARCGLCLGETSCTPSRPPPPERPNYFGHKRYYFSRNIAPMPSAPKPVTNLQQ